MLYVSACYYCSVELITLFLTDEAKPIIGDSFIMDSHYYKNYSIILKIFLLYNLL